MKIAVLRPTGDWWEVASGSEAGFFLKMNRSNRNWWWQRRHDDFAVVLARIEDLLSASWQPLPRSGLVTLCGHIGHTMLDLDRGLLIRQSGSGHIEEWPFQLGEDLVPGFMVCYWADMVTTWHAMWECQRKQDS